MVYLAAGFLHPLHGADHLVAMIAVGIWAVHFGGSRCWRVPLAFTAAMPVGAAAGLANLSAAVAGIVEMGVAASTIVLALLCLTRPSRQRAWLYPIIALA